MSPSNANVPIPGRVATAPAGSHIIRAAAELQRPCFTAGCSRSARARTVRAATLLSSKKRKAEGASPKSPPSPNQEAAVNPKTGRVALGPWLGPYETHPSEAAEPLFLDHAGNTYASLSQHKLKGVEAPAPASKLLPVTAGTAPGAAATEQLYAMVNKVVRRQQAAAGQARAPDKRAAAGSHPHHSGRCGNVMARAINQPRRN